MAQHFILKTEPETYSFEDLQREGRACWDGVRSFEARRNLAAMAVGDTALIYHSGKSRQIVGVARVVRGGYPDPTDPSGTWTAVDVAPERALSRPVSLAELRAAPGLDGLLMLRRPRLSVVPVGSAELRQILRLARTQPEGS